MNRDEKSLEFKRVLRSYRGRQAGALAGNERDDQSDRRAVDQKGGTEFLEERQGE